MGVSGSKKGVKRSYQTNVHLLPITPILLPLTPLKRPVTAFTAPASARYNPYTSP